ncbi:hypothetical protein [Streptomyces sp. MS191]|uniref:hypothetical protein n=1 Tax=Streptomyces sp. ms191 TaxID=1827978 RepID=UPI0021C84C1E|nr:hypothetical protein [Streptomyces sp. ms191]
MRALHAAEARIAMVCGNHCPHLTTKRCQWVGTWVAANNVVIAYTPISGSLLHRIEVATSSGGPNTQPTNAARRRQPAEHCPI